ncbi:NRDE family protein [Bacillus sp. FJAT-44742]|uniref:NRDE family protein n=1 Tax=Bacillus sp. FJAT-44742 TaxID=2014005 RepID=UPI000C2396F1|nr:NRDE family protein [Bacillus sp. FJAT-44742]
MCLVAVAYKVHSKYPLIIAANRDEFYNRPTSLLHQWKDAPFVYAGRDLKKGGTWMGMTKHGYLAALTNVRDGNEKEKERSRGEITAGFLKKEDTESFFQKLSKEKDEFNGFNLIAGTVDNLFYYSNKQEGREAEAMLPGIHGLSNAQLNSPWPKVDKVKQKMKKLIQDEPFTDLPVEPLFAALTDTDKAPDQFLPNTGISIEMERLLSSPFIISPSYGTRSQTVLAVTADYNAKMIERTFTNGGQVKEQSFSFPIQTKEEQDVREL